jgi:hypothetical protein
VHSGDAYTYQEDILVFDTNLSNPLTQRRDKLVEGTAILVSSTGTADDIRGELVHIDLMHKFACVNFCDRKDHSTDALFDGIGYTVTQPDFEVGEVWSDGSSDFIGRAGGIFDLLRRIPVNCIRTDPSFLEDKIAQFGTDDLACFVNVNMFQHVVAEFFQDDWVPPCHKLVMRHILFTHKVPITRFPSLMNCFAVLLLGRSLNLEEFLSFATLSARIYRLQLFDWHFLLNDFKVKITTPDEHGFPCFWYFITDDSKHHKEDRHAALMSALEGDKPCFKLLTTMVAALKNSDGNSRLNVCTIMNMLPLHAVVRYGGNVSNNASGAMLEGALTFRLLWES